jgi:hypothetical protein
VTASFTFKKTLHLFAVPLKRWNSLRTWAVEWTINLINIVFPYNHYFRIVSLFYLAQRLSYLLNIGSISALHKLVNFYENIQEDRVTADWVVLDKSLVRNSVRRLAMLSECFRSYIQSLQTNASNYLAITSFHILPTSLFNNDSTILHYIFWAADKAGK